MPGSSSGVAPRNPRISSPDVPSNTASGFFVFWRCSGEFRSGFGEGQGPSGRGNPVSRLSGNPGRHGHARVRVPEAVPTPRPTTYPGLPGHPALLPAGVRRGRGTVRPLQLHRAEPYPQPGGLRGPHDPGRSERRGQETMRRPLRHPAGTGHGGNRGRCAGPAALQGWRRGHVRLRHGQVHRKAAGHRRGPHRHPGHGHAVQRRIGDFRPRQAPPPGDGEPGPDPPGPGSGLCRHLSTHQRHL